ILVMGVCCLAGVGFAHVGAGGHHAGLVLTYAGGGFILFDFAIIFMMVKQALKVCHDKAVPLSNEELGKILKKEKGQIERLRANPEKRAGEEEGQVDEEKSSRQEARLKAAEDKFDALLGTLGVTGVSKFAAQ
nr:hypothetical protein [Chlamydiota bacterium]